MFAEEAVLASSAVVTNSANEWGPVRPGFAVWLADGRRGSVREIRRGPGGAVELLVVTGLFFRTLVTVRAAEIEEILPNLRRIIVGEPQGREDPGADRDVPAGTITRLPTRRSATGLPRDAA